jgi:MFS transporter, putative metabolite:H+ symporter
MIGFIAKYIPASGALGMSLVGAIGMFSTSIFQPITGAWIDSDKAVAAAQGLTGDELVLVAGQATLGSLVIFPAILIVAFTALFFWMKSKEAAETVEATA